MSLGRMRHKVIIQSKSATSDGAGGSSIEWKGTNEIWAHVKPMSERENFKGMQLEESKTYEITVRYRTGVTAGQIIKFGERLFNIKQVRNRDERNKYLDILCEEGVAI